MAADSDIPPEMLAGMDDVHAAAARLFWKRDFQHWEKAAALRLLEMEVEGRELGRECRAGRFALVGLERYGASAAAAALREGSRAVHAPSHFEAIQREMRQELGWAKAAWLGWAMLAAFATIPSGKRDFADRILIGALAFSVLCGVFAPLALFPKEPAALAAVWHVGQGAWSAAALALGLLGGASSSASFAREIGEKAPGMGASLVEAWPYLVMARWGGLHSRLRGALRKPSRISPLRNVEEGVGYDDLSDAVRRQAPQDFKHGPKSLPDVAALRSELEALELAGAVDAGAREPREGNGRLRL